MKKKLFLVVALVAVLAIGLVGTGASWSVQTQADTNALTAGTFDVSISNVLGGTGSKTVSGVWTSPFNWAPGDDPITGTVYLHNSGNVPVNVVWSGFALTGDPVFADNICVTEFSDSTGSTSISDLASFVDPAKGCVTLTKASQAFGNGYFSNGNDTHKIFIPASGNAWIKLTLAFRADAGNDTIGKVTGFTWYLTAMQTPKNTTP